MSNQTRSSADALVRAGMVVFFIGGLATVGTVTVPLFLGADPLPTAAYLMSMLMAVGFALALFGLVVAARSQRRRRRQNNQDEQLTR